MTATTPYIAPITYIAFAHDLFWGSGETAELAEADARATLEQGLDHDEVESTMTDMHIVRVALYDMHGPESFQGDRDQITFIGDIQHNGQGYAVAVEVA